MQIDMTLEEYKKVVQSEIWRISRFEMISLLNEIIENKTKLIKVIESWRKDNGISKDDLSYKDLYQRIMEYL